MILICTNNNMQKLKIVLDRTMYCLVRIRNLGVIGRKEVQVGCNNENKGTFRVVRDRSSRVRLSWIKRIHCRITRGD